MGIKVNGLHIKSYEPLTASKEWGELRHGDEVTVWTKEDRPCLYVKFRFECYFGPSKTQRHDTTPFSILPKTEVRDELDGYYLQKERELKATAIQACDVTFRISNHYTTKADTRRIGHSQYA